MNGKLAFWVNSAIIVIVTATYSSSLAAVFQVNNASQLHSALLNAQNNGQHDIIRIAQGEYVGSFIYSSHATENLTVEGGWQADFSSRVIKAENTVLDGNQNKNVFVFSCDKPISLTIDGITFQNGRSDLNNGAGIYIYILGYDNWNMIQNKVTIKNNIIKNNTASSGTNAFGIGMYLWTYADISINNNIITGNQILDQSNGGVAGGGMYLKTEQQLDIINNFVYDNKASTGGGLYIETSYKQVQISGNTFSHNEAISTNTYGTSSGKGGGLYAHIWGLENPTIITGNIFSSNMSGGYGGGLFLDADGENFAVTNNQFSGNMAARSGGGATIWASSDWVDSIDFINNTVVANQAGDHGGGLELWLSFDSTVANLYNNIFWGNSSTNPGYDMYIDNDYNDNYLASVCNVYNNNFNQSGLGTYVTSPFTINSSNLNNKDPLFAGEWQGNYMLTSSSPCQNTGNNNAPSLPAIDLMGNVRIQGGTVDMGAYEGASKSVTTQPVLSPLMLLLK